MKILSWFLLVAFFTGATCFADDLVVPIKPETTANFLKRMKPALEADERVAKIKQELAKTTVSTLKLRDATLSTAVKGLNDIIHAHNAGKGVLQLPPVRIKQLFIGTPPVKDSKEPTITLSLSEVTLGTAIDYESKLCGFEMEVKPDAIWLKPISTAESLLVHPVYYVPPAICSSKEEMQRWMDDKELPAMGLQSWHFDVKSHLLALECGSTGLPDFEKWYAKKLLQNGSKAAGQK